ncbi:hypothetical protein OAF93_01890 [Planctomycetota bacterium]|nr:hypothetical protein [Planctomycetota bacterium]
MRDLYRLMGLTPSASLDAIRTALEETRDAELRADVETVLLRPERKRDYDQILRTVQQVGELRARLFLTINSKGEEQIQDSWSKGPLREFLPIRSKASRLRVETVLDLQRLQKPEEPRPAKKPDHAPPTPRAGSFSAAGAEAASAAETSAHQQAKGGRDYSGIPGCLLIWGLIAVGSQCVEHCTEKERPAIPTQRTQVPRRTPEPAPFEAPAKRLPTTGIWYDEPAGRNGGPLKITAGPSPIHYFVKVVNVRSGRTTAYGFLQARDSLEFDVPAGRYTVRYAAGQTWYGTEHHFGPATAYAETDREFPVGLGNGFTIDLFSRPYGNLGTDRMRAEDF